MNLAGIKDILLQEKPHECDPLEKLLLFYASLC